MSVDDGGILGPPIPLIESGPADRRLNVVVTGDGYADSDADQDKLRSWGDMLASQLRDELWFPVLGGAMNVWLVKVWSVDSGVELPEECEPRRTYFDGSYCRDPNDPTAVNPACPCVSYDMIAVFRRQLDFTAHAIGLVLNNERRAIGRGWARGDLWCLGEREWERAAVHELAHTAFYVGDEYVDGFPRYTGEESWRPNLTSVTNRANLKWRYFVAHDVPIPTIENADCHPDPAGLPNPLNDDGQVGLFAGGGGHPCGIFHAAYRCKMNFDHTDPLCRVCVDAARAHLSAYAAEDPNAEVVGAVDGILTLDFGQVPFGATMYRAFTVRNRRVGFPAPVEVALFGGYALVSGSETGTVREARAAQIDLRAAVPGPIEAEVTWDPGRRTLAAGGTLVRPVPAGATTHRETLEVTGWGDVALTLMWAPAGPTPAALCTVELRLFDPSGDLVEQRTATNAEPAWFVHSVADGAEGTYTVEIVNRSPDAVNWSLSGYHGIQAPLTLALLDPRGTTVETITAAAVPAALSYTVPAGAIGSYTLVLQIEEGISSYSVNFSTPEPDAALTTPFLWAEGTELEFTLPAPVIDAETGRTVAIGMRAPDSRGSFDATVSVATDDPAHPGFSVLLRGEAVPPVPVDSMLVVDRSGSMAEATGTAGKNKAQVAIEAAKLYISLLRDDDRIGLVRYNQASRARDVLLPMTLATGDGRRDAHNRLDLANLDPDGSTSIGAGIMNGSDVLDAGAGPARAIVVLTDGRQNTDPDIPEAMRHVQTKSPAQRVFAVGLGLNQLEDRLVQIASVTNGVAQITGDLSGPNEFLLQKLYVQILADASGSAFVTDPRILVGPGDAHATEIHLGEIDFEADFIVTLRATEIHPKYADVWLETPDGEQIGPEQASTMANVAYVEDEGHVFYRVQFPPFPDRPGSHVGIWRLWIANRWDPSDGETAEDILVCSPMCKARSDLKLAGRIEQTGYDAGSTMTAILEPTYAGLPYRLDRPWIARVRRPDGAVGTVELEPGAAGTYAGTFADTEETGPYHFWAEAQATSPAGHRVTRHRHMTGIIVK